MDSYLEYVALPNILQIQPPVVQKQAVMYDPILKKLTYHTVELLGLADLSTDETPLTTPCYLCSNGLGMFFVPDLEPTFIAYVKPGQSVKLSTVKDKVADITNWWNFIEKDIQPIKVEPKNNVRFIRRKDPDDDQK